MRTIVVCGSRDFPDNGQAARDLRRETLLGPASELQVFHGGCPTGADRQAAEACERFGIPELAFHANWEKHGRSAGPIRNGEMLRAAVATGGNVIVFAYWDGSSRGTLDCIRQAVALGLYVDIAPALHFSDRKATVAP
jgi:hypothetical protein